MIELFVNAISKAPMFAFLDFPVIGKEFPVRLKKFPIRAEKIPGSQLREFGRKRLIRRGFAVNIRAHSRIQRE